MKISSPPRPTRSSWGIEHELFEDFSLGANYIYRRDFDLVSELNTDVDLAEYSRYTESSSFTGQTFDAWTYTGDGGTFSLLTNAPSANRKLTFNGVEIVARKRWSDGWQLSGSLTLGENNFHVTPEFNRRGFRAGPATSPNPNDVEFQGGQSQNGQNDFTAGGQHSRWIFKLSGSYELPWQIMLSGFLNMRDGYPIEYYKWGEPPDGITGRAPAVLTEPLGDSRYDTMALFDWRVEKSFELPYGRIGVIFDMFNTFNANTVLTIQSRENIGNFQNVLNYLSPRIIRFGVRYRF